MKIALADDHALYRKGIAALLEDIVDAELIFEAENGQDLLDKLQHQQAELILLDLEMPILDGIATLPRIKSSYPDCKVVIISLHSDEGLLFQLKELGADGFIQKDADFEVWEAAIECLKTEGSYF